MNWSVLRKLLLGAFLLSGFALYGQTVTITGIIDGDLSGGQPKALELYVCGTLDLSPYTIERASNGGTFGSSFNLSGTYTDAYVYVVNNTADFSTVFGNTGDFANTIVNANISGNGNDAFRLLDGGGTVVDQVAAADGADIYQDSYMYRDDNTGPDAGWVPGNWTIPGNDELDGLSAAQMETRVPFGTYTSTTCAPSTCAITNEAISTAPTCNGLDADFVLSFDGTDGSGDYEVVDANTDDVYGTFTGAATGTGLSIDGTVPAPTGGNVEVFIRDENDASCVSGNLTLTLPDCSPATVGFDLANRSISETGGTATVDVTLDKAPAGNLTVGITDAGTGSATSGADYAAFGSASLTFNTGATYPNTQQVSISVNDDLLAEGTETVELTLAITTGDGSTVTGITTFTLRIVDDEVSPGLIVNEFSQGASGLKEFIELLVIGTPGTTVDLRGWVIDDNNGDFSAGPSTSEGVANGYIEFEDHCTWEKVPVGALLVLYNSEDPNGAMPADDLTDRDADLTYVLPIGDGSVGTCGNPAPNAYFDAHADFPTIGDGSYADSDQDPCWNLVSLRNGGDAAQVRSPGSAPALFHGISYGGGGDLGLAQHPDEAILGTDALYFTESGSDRVFYFDNTTDNDYQSKSNWATGTSTEQTPGAPNSSANEAYIQGLRQDLAVARTNSDYTCELRAFESRSYINAADEIFLRVNNQEAIDHGSTRAEVAYDGAGAINFNLTDKPYFYRARYTIEPDLSAATAEYTLDFYLNQGELADLTNDYNAALTASGYTGTAFSEAEVLAGLRVYKAATDPLTVSGDGDTEWLLTDNAVYSGSDHRISTGGEFDSFSDFRLAVVTTENQTFPVEWLSFTARAQTRHIALQWTTASETNNAYFVVERSPDGVAFAALGDVEGAGNSHAERRYTFADEAPHTGWNHYRLRQVDFDGQESRSRVRSVLWQPPEAVVVWAAYPQPATHTLTLEVTSTSEESLRLTLFDLQGRQVHADRWTGQSGRQQLNVDLQTLPAGRYFYRLAQAGQATSGWVEKR